MKGLISLALGLSLFSCSTASSDFKYTVYGVNPSKDLLLGKDASEDLSLSATCNPDEKEAGKCVVLKMDEYERMKTDLIHLEEEVGKSP